MIGWVAGVGGVALAAWVWLVLGQGWFWRTDQRLPVVDDSMGTPGRPWPAVAVVVPARDEADVLPVSLPSLLGQRYPGSVRVIVVDDNSTDGTGELAARLGAEVTTPGELPAGWTGKLWAVAHGIAAAGDVDYLLLTDADIAHGPDSLAAMVSFAVGARVDLVSQMAVLRTETVWERLIVPAFVYFFAMLYPFRWVNRPRGRTAAAAGGCMVVRREALARTGGIAAIRGAIIDDVALGRLVKRSGGRIWLGLADGGPMGEVGAVARGEAAEKPGLVVGLAAGAGAETAAGTRVGGRVDGEVGRAVIGEAAQSGVGRPVGGMGADRPDGGVGVGEGWVRSVRAYPGLGDLWRMVARSAYTQLRYSPVLLAGTVVGLGVVFVAPVVVTVLGVLAPVGFWVGGAALVLMVGSFVPMVRYYRQPWVVALALPVVAVLYLGMTVDSARRHWVGRGALWKGRSYSAGGGV